MTDLPRRKSTRLRTYNYATPDWYVVTLVTEDRLVLFGHVVDSEMRLNAAGRIVERIWKSLPERFPHVELDAYIVMPNHMHGIIVLNEHPHSGEDERLVGEGLAPPGADTRASQVGESTLSHPSATRDEADDDLPSAHAPRREGQSPPLQQPSLTAVVGVFKSISTIEVNRAFGRRGVQLWQRSFYDHIIRDDRDAERMQGYIESNPGMWAADRENPLATVTPRQRV